MGAIEELKGKVINRILVNQEYDDEVYFYTECDKIYKMYHSQDCCENVYINNIDGDLEDLIGSNIVMSEEVVSDERESNNDYESSTWTFYKFATIKGYVTFRWIGVSNGYYSESVDFVKVK